MKKSVGLWVSFSLVVIGSMAQMPSSNLPRFVRWVDPNQIVINTKQNDDKTAKDYVYNLVTKQYTAAPAAAASSDKSVFVKNANVFVKENGVETQLTFDAAEEKNPTLSPDGKFVGYTKNNNLFTVLIADKKETAITNEDTKGILNGYASWVYFEEIFGRPTQYLSLIHI